MKKVILGLDGKPLVKPKQKKSLINKHVIIPPDPKDMVSKPPIGIVTKKLAGELYDKLKAEINDYPNTDNSQYDEDGNLEEQCPFEVNKGVNKEYRNIIKEINPRINNEGLVEVPKEVPKPKVNVFNKQIIPKHAVHPAMLVKEIDKFSDERLIKKTDPPNNIIIEALAGTGKTFTIVEGCKLILGKGTPGIVGSEEQKVIWGEMLKHKGVKSIRFAAFTNVIADALAVSMPPGCEVSTIHSLGSRILRQAGMTPVHTKAWDNKTNQILVNLFGSDYKKYYPGLYPVFNKVVEWVKQNIITVSLKNSGEIVEKFQVHSDTSIDGNYVKVISDNLHTMMSMHASMVNKIDISDLLWLPWVLKLPVNKSDLIIVDEFQDLSPCQQALVFSAAKSYWLVGDPNQAIYGFAGADKNSMSNGENYLKGLKAPYIKMKLTTTRRCCKAVVSLCNKFVPEFRALPDAKEGSVIYIKESELPKYFVIGTKIISRYNYPLVKLALGILARNIRCCILGKDLESSMIDTLKKHSVGMNDDTPTKVFLLNMNSWVKDRLSCLLVSESPSSVREAEKLEEISNCISIIGSECSNLGLLKERINVLFSELRPETCITLGSIHKMKGLEASRVILLGHGKLPVPSIKPEDAQQEINLVYVAYSRAKETLILVE